MASAAYIPKPTPTPPEVEHAPGCTINFSLNQSDLDEQQKKRLILYYLINLNRHVGPCCKTLMHGFPRRYTFFSNFKTTDMKFNFKWFIHAYLLNEQKSNPAIEIINKMFELMPDGLVNTNFDWTFFENLPGFKICPLCKMLLAVFHDINRFGDLVYFLNENSFDYEDILRAVFIRTKQQLIDFLVEITERLDMARHGSTVWNPGDNDDLDLICDDSELDLFYGVLKNIFQIHQEKHNKMLYGDIPITRFSVNSPFLCYCSKGRVDAIKRSDYFSDRLEVDCYETGKYTEVVSHNSVFHTRISGYKSKFPASFGRTHHDQVEHAQSNVKRKILTARPLPLNMSGWSRLFFRYNKYMHRGFTVGIDMSQYDGVYLAYKMSIPSMIRLITDCLYSVNYGEPGVAKIVVEYIGTHHFTDDKYPCSCLHHFNYDEFLVGATCSNCGVKGIFCLHCEEVHIGHVMSFICKKCV